MNVERKKNGMNVERSIAGTKKSRQPKCLNSVNLVQSRQSLTTVRPHGSPTRSPPSVFINYETLQ